jgi:hypothetical protein
MTAKSIASAMTGGPIVSIPAIPTPAKAPTAIHQTRESHPPSRLGGPVDGDRVGPSICHIMSA